jgi:hypothetical protein
MADTQEAPLPILLSRKMGKSHEHIVIEGQIEMKGWLSRIFSEPRLVAEFEALCARFKGCTHC